jgi:hypothetical protein
MQKYVKNHHWLEICGTPGRDQVFLAVVEMAGMTKKEKNIFHCLVTRIKYLDATCKAGSQNNARKTRQLPLLLRCIPELEWPRDLFGWV